MLPRSALGLTLGLTPGIFRACLFALLVSACAHAPMDYIPPTDRSMLQAQARLGGDETAAPKTSIAVDDLLANARTQGVSPARTGRLVLHFEGTEATLDAAQKTELGQFVQGQSAQGQSAQGSAARTLRVIARKHELAEDPTMLNQRRAVATAHVLQAQGASADIGFAVTTPPNDIIVTVAPLTPAPSPGDAP